MGEFSWLFDGKEMDFLVALKALRRILKICLADYAHYWLCLPKKIHYGPYLAGFISLQELMNFTYTVIKPPDGRYGAIQPDGTWNGMVKLLADQDIDIAAATIAVTLERSTVMTFATPIMEVYFSLFIKNPADIFNTMAYIEPMQWLVWIGMLVFLASVPPLLYLAVR